MSKKRSNIGKKSRNTQQKAASLKKNNPDGVLKRPQEKKKFMDMTPESQEVISALDESSPKASVGDLPEQSQHGSVLSEERRQHEHDSGRTSLICPLKKLTLIRHRSIFTTLIGACLSQFVIRV